MTEYERWKVVFTSLMMAAADTIDKEETRNFLISRAMQYGRAWLVQEDEIDYILSHTLDDTLNARNQNYLTPKVDTPKPI